MKKLYELIINRPNRWYDSLNEPYRFIVFILPMSALNIMLINNHYLLLGIIFVLLTLWRWMYLEE